MLTKNLLKLRLYQSFFCKLAVVGVLLAKSQFALALTADEVLNKMSLEERVAYIAGVIEGFAMSRWVVDKPDDTGMQCIYSWYYDGGDKSRNVIYAWLENNPDKPVGALMYTLFKRECGAIK